MDNSNACVTDRMLGVITRAVEKAGVHLWSIFPIAYEWSPETKAVYVSLRWMCDNGDAIAADFAVDGECSDSDIAARLATAVCDADEFREEHGLQWAPSSRTGHTQAVAWEEVMI